MKVSLLDEKYVDYSFKNSTLIKNPRLRSYKHQKTKLVKNSNLKKFSFTSLFL